VIPERASTDNVIPERASTDNVIPERASIRYEGEHKASPLLWTIRTGRAQGIAPTMDECAWEGRAQGIAPTMDECAWEGRAQGIAPTMDDPRTLLNLLGCNHIMTNVMPKS
jgi:hypothetical protein